MSTVIGRSPDPLHFSRVAPLLEAVGMAQAAGENELDLEMLAGEVSLSRADLEDSMNGGFETGLVASHDGLELTHAGRQFLRLKGEVRRDALDFLPNFVDDLFAREALLRAGSVMVDLFHADLVQGRIVERAKEVVPPVFGNLITEHSAIRLYSAAVAMVARLTEQRPPACTAEELMVVELLSHAEVELDVEHGYQHRITSEEKKHAVLALLGVWELVGDDDVVDLWADIATAPMIRQRQAFDHWFEPLRSVAGTGHLSPRPYHDN